MSDAAEPGHPLVSYLEATLGLSFTGPRRARLLATLEAERAAAGLSPEAFLAAASVPGRTFDRVVAAVTVGETYFFRDRAQVDLLRKVVLPELVTRTGPARRIAMWSAGCASGEEAVTLAALAHEAGLGDRVAVVGSDASSRAVEKAERGVYGRWSMRSITPEEQAAHFREEGGRFLVEEHLRRRLRFVQRNLLDGPPPPGRFDLVLCRNLLIYLTRDAVQRAAEILTAALAPGGWLLTAAGDPPLEADGLQPVRTRFGLAYQQGTAPAAARAVPPAPPREETSRPARAVAPPARPRATRPVAAPPRGEAVPAPAEVLAAQIRSLGDAGRLDDACRTALAASQAHPLDVELRYLTGVVLLENGRLEEAAAAASSAVYLGADLAAAHLLLGQVEHARGNTERARRSFRNGSRLLATAPADAPVALTGEVPAGHLAAIADRYLSADAGRR